jgi:hypothetical protein
MAKPIIRDRENKLKLPKVQLVRESILYDPHTGEFFWKWRPSSHFGNNGDYTAAWNVKYAGAPCGSNNSVGYTQINFGWPILAHRVAWAIMTGKWSKKTIDHINCDRRDNRWCNLREATRLQQTWNRTVPKRTNITLPTGVYPKYGKYQAQIRINGKPSSLGVFDTPEEAHAAWVAAAKKLHGEFFNSFSQFTVSDDL